MSPPAREPRIIVMENPEKEITAKYVLSPLEKLQERLDEELQKSIDNADGGASLSMNLHCTSGDPPAVSQPDLHTTNNQSSLKDSSSCSTGLDKQHSGSPPALSSGTSLSPVSSSVSTPQNSSEHPPLIQREQCEENEKTNSDGQLSPKFRRLDRLWDASEEKFTIMEPAAERGNHDATQTEDCIFLIRRDFNCDKTQIKTTVEVKDSLLEECIQNVTGNIFGINFTEGNPVFDPKILFLYLDDFRSHHDSLEQVRPYNKKDHWLENQWNIVSAKRSLKLLIEYLEEEFAEGKKNLDLMLGKGVITFDLLWALWKPHTLIYSPTYRCHDVPGVSMVICAEKCKGRLSTNPEYSVEARFVDFNGKTLTYKTLKQEIQHFDGAVNITSLPVYPLQYHKDEARIRRVLIERGAKFVSLQGIHHKSYTGIAFPLVKSKNQTYTNEDETFNKGVQPQCLMDMLSTEKAEDDQQNLRSDVKISEGSPRGSNTWSKRECMEKAKPEMAKDNLLLLCSPVIVGYSLASLEWLEFDVRCIDDVKWNEEAWDSLVLDEKMKELIKASVASHISNSAFDVNNGAMAKRKGLTKKYNCLDVERDSLVATLSRRLESFQGIIFLTCDTIRVFDEAFQSRIDFFQKYDKPDRKSKSIILKRAISRVTALNLCETETFSDEEYGKLVESDLSGREVEKAVELALSLAEARKEPLGVRHLQDVMDIQEKFRCDFGKKDYGNYFS
ncbi:hypothetical protein ACSS6W_001861 [Trichoderma asperelloides]